MNDMTMTIIPKSDQINFDELFFTGPRTIKITAVTLTKTDQPCAVNFEGDGGKVFRPCKSMRKVMVHVWGKYTDKYIGHSMTLYGDPDVQFGGKKVGGIRISHITGIDKPISVVLTETKGRNKPFTVAPLVVSDAIDVDKLKERASICANNGVSEYQDFWKSLTNAERSAIKQFHDDFKTTAAKADKGAADETEME
jgi:hypothetical protein